MISDDLRRELNQPPRTRQLVTPAKPSVAQIVGHALHPILVAFPITFYSIATASFIAYAMNAQVFWFRAAFYASIAGVISAVIAAVPGLMDYFGSIPAQDPAKKVARTHAGFNTLSLFCYASIVALLWNSVTPEAVFTESVMTPMWISIVGLASTLVAGYFGGSLVQQHHVGIEPGREPVTSRKVLSTGKIQPRTSMT